MTGIISILPELGPYALEIWATYIVSLGGLGLLGYLSWRKKRTLETIVKTAEKNEKKKSS